MPSFRQTLGISTVALLLVWLGNPGNAQNLVVTSFAVLMIVTSYYDSRMVGRRGWGDACVIGAIFLWPGLVVLDAISPQLGAAALLLSAAVAGALYHRHARRSNTAASDAR